MTRAEIIDEILRLINQAADLADDPRLDSLYKIGELRGSLANAGEAAGKNEGCDDAGDDDDDQDDDDDDDDDQDGDDVDG